MANKYLKKNKVFIFPKIPFPNQGLYFATHTFFGLKTGIKEDETEQKIQCWKREIGSRIYKETKSLIEYQIYQKKLLRDIEC